MASSSSTASTSGANTAAAAVQANLNNRKLLLATATPMRKLLGTYGPFTAGQLATIKLRNVGILTGVDLVVSAEITITTAAVPTAYGPFNFVKAIQYNDFNNTNRINISHRALTVVESLRTRRLVARGFLSDLVDTPAVAGSVAGQIQLPTAVVTPSGTNFRVPVSLPICYDENSNLKGAVLAQTDRGEQYVSVQLPTNAQVFGSTDDAVYSSGAGSVGNIYITAYQKFLQPQPINGQLYLPTQDLVTVYELNGNMVSTSDLAVGQAKYINYPNARQVLSSVHIYFNGSATVGDGFTFGTDMTKVEIELSANTTMSAWNGPDLYDTLRRYFNGDLFPGAMAFDHRRVPIDTVDFGQVQAKLTPSEVNANAYVESTFESFYLLGTELPGIATG